MFYVSVVCVRIHSSLVVFVFSVDTDCVSLLVIFGRLTDVRCLRLKFQLFVFVVVSLAVSVFLFSCVLALLLWLNTSLLEGFIHRCYWDVFIYSVLVSVLCVRFRVRSSCFLCLASKLFVCFVLVFVSVRFRVYLWLHGCFCDRFCCFGKCLLHFFVLCLLSDHILGRVKKSFCVGMCFIYLVSVSAFGFDFVFVPVVFVFRVDIDCVLLLLTFWRLMGVRCFCLPFRSCVRCRVAFVFLRSCFVAF